MVLVQGRHEPRPVAGCTPDFRTCWFCLILFGVTNLVSPGSFPLLDGSVSQPQHISLRQSANPTEAEVGAISII